MNMVQLTPLDLTLASLLVLALAAVTIRMRLGLGWSFTISAARTTIQLLLVGMVLKTLFANVKLEWVILLAMIMLMLAGREVRARQKHKFKGFWGFGVGVGSMFVSSFTVTTLTLVLIINVDPWFTPQYAIPLLGMLLGNTMNGIALSIDRLTESVWQQRTVLEQRLLLGQDRKEAIHDIHKNSLRTGMIPILNSMAAAGIISLPGMMTGQILAGSSPTEAVKYQILIMFLIAAGTGFGVIVALWFASRRLFDERHRLRLDRLTPIRGIRSKETV